MKNFLAIICIVGLSGCAGNQQQLAASCQLTNTGGDAYDATTHWFVGEQESDLARCMFGNRGYSPDEFVSGSSVEHFYHMPDNVDTGDHEYVIETVNGVVESWSKT